MVGMAVPWKTNFGNTATINSGPNGDKSELGLGSYMFADATDILRSVFGPFYNQLDLQIK